MKKFLVLCLFLIGLGLTILSQAILPGNGELTLAASPQELSAYEVWAIDQSNSLDGTLLGGNLYILSGNDKDFIKGTAKIEQINLGTNAFDEGFEPGQKPHWTAFNKGATHLIVGHASSGHVYESVRTGYFNGDGFSSNSASPNPIFV